MVTARVEGLPEVRLYCDPDSEGCLQLCSDGVGQGGYQEHLSFLEQREQLLSFPQCKTHLWYNCVFYLGLQRLWAHPPGGEANLAKRRLRPQDTREMHVLRLLQSLQKGDLTLRTGHSLWFRASTSSVLPARQQTNPASSTLLVFSVGCLFLFLLSATIHTHTCTRTQMHMCSHARTHTHSQRDDA